MPVQELAEYMIRSRPGDEKIGLRIVRSLNDNGQATSTAHSRLSDLRFARWLLHDEPDRCLIVLSLEPDHEIELTGEIALAHIQWIKAGCPCEIAVVLFGAEGRTIAPLYWWQSVKAGASEPREEHWQGLKVQFDDCTKPMFERCTFAVATPPTASVWCSPHAAEMDALKAQIEDLKERLRSTGKAHAALSIERDQLQERLARANRDVERNLGYRDSTKEAQALAKVRDELTAIIVTLTAERDDLKSRVDRQARTIDEFLAEEKALTAERDRLTAIIDQQAKTVLNLTGKHELTKAYAERVTKERDEMKAKAKRLDDWVTNYPIG